jgi:glycosyltransferase involved in cell wall biosynthesis
LASIVALESATRKLKSSFTLISMVKPIGINIIGHASSSIGLGVVAREFATALAAKGHPVQVLDSDPGGGRVGQDMTLSHLFVRDESELTHPVNIWIMGIPGLLWVAQRIADEPELKKRLNVAFAWWELPHIAEFWKPALMAFDGLLGGSEFICQTLSNSVAGVPVLLARHPLAVPDPAPFDLRRLGSIEGKTLVYSGFEAASDPARKNPFAAISAFEIAASGRNDAQLLVKVNNPKSSGAAAPMIERLQAIAKSNPRITLLTERFGYSELISLYSACDIFMSLHRSEGLGLMPLEAMRLGKPVIATGWSGNMTYMNYRNSALVDYTFASPGSDASVYSPRRSGVRSYWADPDVAHAGSWLKRLLSDQDLRASIGARARRDSMAYDVQARALDFMSDIEALLDDKASRRPKDYDRLSRLIRSGRLRYDRAGMPILRSAMHWAGSPLLHWYRRQFSSR